jgi:hypothetical protein
MVNLNMLRLFLDNRVWVLLLLPVILALYLFSYFLGYPAPFGRLNHNTQLLSYLANLSMAHVFAHFLMLLLNAITLNWVFNSREFLEKNTFIVSLNYLIFASFFHTWGAPSWLFVAHLFCILGIGLFFGVKPQMNSKKQAFNASFVFGISVLFAPDYIVLLPVLLLMFTVIRGFYFREILLIIIGFLMPIVGVISYYYLSKQDLNLAFLPKLTRYSANWQEYLQIGIFLVIFIFSMLGLRARLLKASLKLKKQTQILTLFSFFIFLLGLGAFFLAGQISLLSLVILPFSFYFSYALLSSSLGISSHLFFYILFIFSLLKFILFTI